ncbi:MAG: DUF2812 domain-containing protein [Solibacillus sp.]
MARLIRKFRPADYWYTEQYESWFSDMSLQGLHIKRIGTCLVKFKKGEPRKMEYRMTLTPDKEISDAQITLYKENGWTYVTSHQYFHIFVAAEGVQTREVPVDLHVLQQLRKALRSNFLFVLIGLIVYIGLVATLWFMDGTPTLLMVEGPVIYQTILVFILLGNLFEPLRGMRTIRRMEKNVRTGRDLDHYAKWRGHWWISRIRSRLVVIFVLLVATMSVMHLIKTDYGSVNTSELELPFIHLAQLESNLLVNEDDELGWYSVGWSVFAPVQYEVDEYGTVKTDEGDISVRIETELYELRFQGLVTPLMTDLAKWYTYEEVPAFTKRAHADFDQLLVREALGQKVLIASRGQIVLFARYEGEAKLDDLLARAVQVMQEAGH